MLTASGERLDHEKGAGRRDGGDQQREEVLAGRCPPRVRTRMVLEAAAKKKPERGRAIKAKGQPLNRPPPHSDPTILTSYSSAATGSGGSVALGRLGATARDTRTLLLYNIRSSSVSSARH